MNDVELYRETNDRYFGGEMPVNYGDVGATPGGHRDPDPPEDEETGQYGIRIVYPDGLENDVEYGLTLPMARSVAAHASDLLADSELGARVAIINLDTGRIIDEERT